MPYPQSALLKQSYFSKPHRVSGQLSQPTSGYFKLLPEILAGKERGSQHKTWNLQHFTAKKIITAKSLQTNFYMNQTV